MSKGNPRSLWYRQPAGGEWNAALPLGCGRLGAMVYGNVVQERLELNEDSLWSGGPRDRINPNALENLAEIRRRIFAGELDAAGALTVDTLSGVPDIMRNYTPLGRLWLTFDHATLPTDLEADAQAPAPVPFRRQKMDGVRYYRRELDLNTAIAGVSYEAGGVNFTREYLASAPDQVIALRLTASEPGAINVKLRLERGPRENFAGRLADTVAAIDADGLLMRGRESGEGGVGYAAALRATTHGGRIHVIGEVLEIEGADEVLVVIAAGTTFRESDPAQASVARASAALAKGWTALRSDHLREYWGWFNRMDLKLGSARHRSLYPTDERLRFLQAGHSDPELMELYFHFGRYLLIASSRPGSLPPNLQGIWNQDHFPAWGSKYTININTEMNYWPALPCDLAELQEPLFDLLERLRQSGGEVARRMYGCRGFVVHHNTDLWADACPVDRNLTSSIWLLGGAWLSLHLWEQFRFQRDLAYLRRAYPVLKEAALFFLDFLQRDAQGRLVVVPSTSPENVFRRSDGRPATLCAGTSMDAQILDALFEACAEAATLLGEDAALAAEWTRARADLPKPQVGRGGRLMEWLEDYDDVEPHHRHISHLFALHPGHAISPLTTPELAEACRRTLEQRGDPSTGWSLAWKISCWARLRDGDRAERLLRLLLAPVEASTLSYTGDGGSYPNLFCAHPPFQIDGNFGGTAAIAEMLVQSHLTTMATTGESVPLVDLLPALPTSWPSGTVEGLRARGNLRVSFLWSEGKLERLDLHAPSATRVMLKLGDVTREEAFTEGESKTFDGALQPFSWEGWTRYVCGPPGA